MLSANHRRAFGISRRGLLTGLAVTPLSLTGLRAFSAEPFSWSAAAAYVGLKLLDGAISYVGGKLLASALGDPTISDVRLWIDDAVKEIKAFVSAELQRQLTDIEIKELAGELNGLRDNLYHYASLSEDSRGKNRFLIEHAATHSVELVNRALEFEEAYFIATTALAYRYFVVQALYEIDKSEGHANQGHIVALKPTIDRALTKLTEARNNIEYAMSPDRRYSISCEEEVLRGKSGLYERERDSMRKRNGHGSVLYRCYGMDRGRRITENYTRIVELGVGHKREIYSAIQSDVEDELRPLTEPMQRRSEEFVNLANASLHRISHGYGVMKSNIGENYELPTGIDAIPPVEELKFPSVIEMPGATVRRDTI